ncbi:CAP domain-containing protein [Massilia sp. Mn16-1_5]|uniref:CAP domain-containing protein n=1 Tax=Massilia sp. Mn16-1_5 TaxID=2079199 RepID=UPI00109EAE96|nr:CAP domain-containing protein [Massilia sp. Mn16-1_5]THC44296.1 CAP domain-containing protein [Massilia sp. Mn16-1_5]
MRYCAFKPFLAAAALLAGSAQAQNDARLVALVNAMRAAPGACGGARPAPAPALKSDPRLARVRIGAGTFPEYAVERAGYNAAQVEVISARGAQDEAGVIELIRQPYCRVLLNPEYRDIGATREGDEWTIVLARPLLPLTLPEQSEVGREILDAVNAARAVPRNCGERAFGAAPAVAWNDALAAAALAHSRDMAARRHFGHQGSDGSMVASRATRSGYSWRLVGENIAAGQTSAAEAVAGWIESPGHCANLMNPLFTEMGAGYDISRAKLPGFVYWTQVFGTRR